MNNKAEVLRKIERILETAYFPEGGYEPDAPDEILTLCAEVAREAVESIPYDKINKYEAIEKINKAFGVSDE